MEQGSTCTPPQLQHPRGLAPPRNPLHGAARGPGECCLSAVIVELLHAHKGERDVALDGEIGVGILECGIVEHVMQPRRSRQRRRHIVCVGCVTRLNGRVCHDLMQCSAELGVVGVEQEALLADGKGLLRALEQQQCLYLGAHVSYNCLLRAGLVAVGGGVEVRHNGVLPYRWLQRVLSVRASRASARASWPLPRLIHKRARLPRVTNSLGCVVWAARSCCNALV